MSYLISSKRLPFENIAHDGYTAVHCTWLYLALPDCTQLYLPVPGSALENAPPRTSLTRTLRFVALHNGYGVCFADTALGLWRVKRQG